MVKNPQYMLTTDGPSLTIFGGAESAKYRTRGWSRLDPVDFLCFRGYPDICMVTKSD